MNSVYYDPMVIFFIQEYLISTYYVSGTTLGTGIKNTYGVSSLGDETKHKREMHTFTSHYKLRV